VEVEEDEEEEGEEEEEEEGDEEEEQIDGDQVDGEQVKPPADESVSQKKGPDKPPAPKPPKVPVLPWMRVPLTLTRADCLPLEDVPELDGRIVAALQARGMRQLFPVQTGVWRSSQVRHF
jgi:hypothetical protein